MDFITRTEDLSLEEVVSLFVETDEERKIIEQLKTKNPIILVGSRGMGK